MQCTIKKRCNVRLCNGIRVVGAEAWALGAVKKAQHEKLGVAKMKMLR